MYPLLEWHSDHSHWILSLLPLCFTWWSCFILSWIRQNLAVYIYELFLSRNKSYFFGLHVNLVLRKWEIQGITWICLVAPLPCKYVSLHDLLSSIWPKLVRACQHVSCVSLGSSNSCLFRFRTLTLEYLHCADLTAVWEGRRKLGLHQSEACYRQQAPPSLD